MTEQEFLNQEIARWGEDEVFALIDAGYQTVQLIAVTGEMRWSWVYDKMPALTQRKAYATVGAGSISKESRIAPVLR